MSGLVDELVEIHAHDTLLLLYRKWEGRLASGTVGARGLGFRLGGGRRCLCRDDHGQARRTHVLELDTLSQFGSGLGNAYSFEVFFQRTSPKVGDCD